MLLYALSGCCDETRTVSYEAYLKDAPELVFHLQSKRIYVGEHSKYRNAIDFNQVYGAHYFAQYQQQYPVQYWRSNDKYAFYNFPLEAFIQQKANNLRGELAVWMAVSPLIPC